VASSRNVHYTSSDHKATTNANAISRQYPIIDHEFDAVVVGAGNFLLEFFDKSEENNPFPVSQVAPVYELPSV
jgi:hypothetical protein